MSLRYLGKNLLRNKKRTFLLFFGLMIALALITGINIAGNRMISYQLESTIDSVPVDFILGTQDANSTKIQQTLAHLEGQIPEYLTSYFSTYQSINHGLISKGNPINWTDYSNVTYDNATNYFNRTNLCGLDSSFFEDPAIIDRLDQCISFGENGYNPSTGIYIDQKSALKLNLTIGDNINFGEISFSNEYAGGDIEYTKKTSQMSNITIAGVFSIKDFDRFGAFFTGESINMSYIFTNYFDSEDIILLSNISYFYTIFEQVHVPIMKFLQGPIRSFGLLIDHSKLNLMDEDVLNKQITQIHTRIELADPQIEFKIESPLETMISAAQFQSLMYQLIFIFISVPIMMLGWYLSKTTYYLSYNNRRREIALLKTKGASNRQISLVFYGEALLIGVLGGLTGLIGGVFSSNFILNQVIPNAIRPEEFDIGFFFTQLFSGNYIDQSTLWFGLGISIAISLIAVRDPIKHFIPLDPIEGLQKYHEELQTSIAKKKSDWIWLFIGAFPLIFSFWINNPTGGNPMLFIFYSLFSGLGSALMPIAPFVLLFALIKIFCERSIKTFTKIVSFLTRPFSKPVALFTSKSILRNQARSARFVFLIALSLSFIVMTTSLAATEDAYQTDMRTVFSGNANRVLLSGSNLTHQGIKPYVDYLSQSRHEFGYQNITSYCNSGLVTIQGDGGNNDMIESGNGFYTSAYPTYSKLEYFDISAFFKLCPLKSEWILNDTIDQVMDKLISIPNSTLVPDIMIEKGFRVNDTLAIMYDAQDGTEKQINMQIVGVYSVFPFDSMYSWQKRLIVDNRWFNDISLASYSLLLYPANATSIPLTQIEEYFSKFDASLTVDEYSSYDASSGNLLFSSVSTIIDFANLEKYYLLIMVTFGVGLIMYLSIHEKSHDIGMLRARGVDKKSLYKMQLAEASVLTVLGASFSTVGFLGAYGVMGQLNLLQFSNMAIQRSLVIPWGSIVLNLAATFILFIIVICLSIWKELKQSEVGPISDLLRI